MKNDIPTAEEFFGFISGEISYPPDFVHRTAIEFAKLHVEAALKEASKYVKIGFLDGLGGEGTKDIGVDKQSIFNSYPLTNIK